MTKIQTIDFHGDRVPVLTKNGKQYVSMKPIAEYIGLDWSAQFRRLKRNEVLSKGIAIMATPSAGGDQTTVALPAEYLNGWLFGIDANRVDAEIKDKLIRYQRECYQVLHEHFRPKVSDRQFRQLKQEKEQLLLTNEQLVAEHEKLKAMNAESNQLNDYFEMTIEELRDQIEELNIRPIRLDIEEAAISYALKINQTVKEVYETLSARLKTKYGINVILASKAWGSIPLAIEKVGLGKATLKELSLLDPKPLLLEWKNEYP